MARFSLLHHAELPDGVLVSLEGVSKAPPVPMPQPPRWLARFLPGLEWSAAATLKDRPTKLDGEERVPGRRLYDDGGDSDDEDDEMGDDFDAEERPGVAFKKLDFSVSAGGGLGLVGPDFQVTQTILFMITGYLPPTTGRILVRGRVAPLLKPAALNIANQKGEKAVAITGQFLGWPRDLLRGKRRDQIMEFAALDEITEFPPDSLEWKDRATRRLLQSAVLHLDASVYLVGYNFNRGDKVFSQRCYELLEQRQREGCAIIQNGLEVEDVSRFCQEAIYVENGDPMFRGRLGEVAKFAHERPAEEHAGKPSLPLRALLVGEGGIEIGPSGGKIEIELDVFSKKKLDVDFAMLFTDDTGRETRVERPEPFVTSDPGVYRLRLFVPGGLLGDSSYKAKLLASGANGASGGEDALLSFDLVSRGPRLEDSAPELEPDFAGMSGSEDLAVEPRDFEWNVRRVTT